MEINLKYYWYRIWEYFYRSVSKIYMSLTSFEESNLDKLLAGLIAGGFQERSFEADDAARAVREEIGTDMNNLEIWTALQDGTDGGFLVVNRLGQYRLTRNGVEQGTETLRNLDTGFDEFGIQDVDS